jgi:hypothetical protein
MTSSEKYQILLQQIEKGERTVTYMDLYEAQKLDFQQNALQSNAEED